MNFDQSFEKLLGHEGLYTNNPKDPGNWTGGKIGVGELKGTKYGISAGSYPSEDIKNLTVDRVKVLYKRDYWDKVKADLLPDAVRFDMFDAAVNSGVGRAVMFLQQALGFKGTAVDGVFGKDTKDAVAQCDPQLLDKRINGYRLKFMAEAKVWPDFSKGWALRIANNLIGD